MDKPTKDQILRARRKNPEFLKQEPDEDSRKSRRNLMAVVGIWILVVPLELAPKRFSSLDIDLADAALSPALLTSILLVYFWLSFFFYNYRYWTEFRVRGMSLLDQLDGNIKEKRSDLSDVESFLKTQSDKENETLERSINWTIRKNEKSKTTNIRNAQQMLTSIPSDVLNVELERGRISRDFYFRSAWDYIFPMLTIALPICHFVSVQYKLFL